MDIEALHMRREARRRAVRRRRLQAVGVIVLVVAAVVIVLSTRPGGASNRAGSQKVSADSAARAPRSAPSVQRQSTSAPLAGARPGTQSLPILMYHVIAAPPAGAPFPGLYVTPSEFAAQMQALKNAGWHAVTL